MDIKHQLRQGILAAKAGDKDQARALLLEVVETDENQLHAWLWLSYVVDNLEDKQICLENALALDPENDFAQRGLDWVRAQKNISCVESPPSVIPPIDPTVKYPQRDEFDDEWLCPYCAKPTAPEDTACPHCQRSLVARQRVRPERTVWLWRGFFLQLYIAFYTIALPVGYVTLAATLQNISNPLASLPAYLGRTVNQSPAAIKTVLHVFPLWAFWLTLAVAFYSLILMLLLYFRVPYAHLMYLLNAGLTLVAGLIGVVFAPAWWVRFLGGIGIALSLLQLLITVNLWKDFTFKETRLLFKVDVDATNAVSLYFCGREYGRRGMWGLATLHLRRAAARRPANVGYWLALTVACLNIHRPQLAQQSLLEAVRLDPASPEAKDLQQKIARMTTDE